jgi:hypothetical protein
MKREFYSWTVRFDVASTWVADGFSFSDFEALDMLSDRLDFANMDTELRARVIAAPPTMSIAKEQGYDVTHRGHNAACEGLMKVSPHAYRLTGGATLDKALIDAIGFMSNNIGDRDTILKELREAVALIRGTQDI